MPEPVEPEASAGLLVLATRCVLAAFVVCLRLPFPLPIPIAAAAAPITIRAATTAPASEYLDGTLRDPAEAVASLQALTATKASGAGESWHLVTVVTLAWDGLRAGRVPGSGPDAFEAFGRYADGMHEDVTAMDVSGGNSSPGTMEFPAHAVGARNELRPHVRLLHGMRHPANWLQLIRFGIVGGSGFVLNLVVYAACVHLLSIDYHVAAVVAWLLAVMNNFALNRHWTFDAKAGKPSFQALRFFVVSLVAFGFSLLLLMLFVGAGGMAKVPAQALAVIASTPFNFLGNKLWSFRLPS